MTKTLYLVDTYAQIFRSFFAIRTDMRSGITGEPTQAIFAMTGFLLKLLGKYSPDYVVAVVDAPGPTFRDALLDDYKGTRAATPPDLKTQIPRILSLIDSLGILRIERAGLEADDIIAAITRHVLADPDASDVHIRIASKDKDLLQLLGPRVTLFDIQSEVETDAAALFAAKGIAPSQVIDYLTLIGDTVDNVPGVPGIGPKTAMQLLQEFGTLDSIYDNLDALPVRRRDLLLQAREQTVRSRVLVTLKDDDDCSFRLDDARPRPIDLPATLHFFEQVDIHRFAGETRRLADERERERRDRALESADPFASLEPFDALVPEAAQSDHLPLLDCAGFEIVSMSDALLGLAAELKCRFAQKPGREPDAADLLAVTVETSCDGVLSAIGLAWGDAVVRSVCIPFLAFNETANVAQPADFSVALRAILEDDVLPKVIHDGKRAARALLTDCGIALRGVVFDTFLAATVEERESAERRSLVRALLSCRLTESENPCAERVVEGAIAALRLAPLMRATTGARGMDSLVVEIEAPLGPILARMEHAGIICDAAELERQGDALSLRVADLKQAILEAAGFDFDINSPQQLGSALFDRLGLPPGKRTKTGYSTDKEVLETLTDDEDPAIPATTVPRLILEYRQLTKLLSTYLGNLRQAIRPETGRIHTTFRQMATATGRLASDGPNLQNIPVRSLAGREIRAAFRAPANHVFLSADYSQIELRLLAHLSEDEAMIEAFLNGRDIHTAVAMEVFRVETADAVTRAQRDQAKTINFGIVYGISPFGLARRIKSLDRTAAGELIANYRARYTRIDRFFQTCIERAKTDGYVTTLSGRRRPIPEIRSRATAALGERLAINTVVQGSAADLIKRAMVRVQERIDREGLPARMLLQIHDELLFECPADAASACAQSVREEMEAAFTLKVPLVVECGFGENWRDAK